VTQTSASLNRQILALAIPAIVANITTPLLSLVDVTIVGHLGSAAFVGAIAVGGSMFSMLYWLFGFLRFGTSGLTAQAVGRHDSAEVSLTLQRSLTVALAIAAALLLLHVPLGRGALALIGTDSATEAMAWRYFSILIWGAPATLAGYAITGYFVGVQCTRMAMWMSLLINVSNIGCSLLLVYVCHLQIEGVALGSLLAQYVGTLFGLAVCCRRFGFRLHPMRQVLNAEKLQRFFVVNVDIMLRTVCLIAVTVWFTHSGAQHGELTLAANTLLLQFFMLFSYFMDGFAFAGEALCGKFFGARNADILRRCTSRLFQWATGIAVVSTGVLAVGMMPFMHLLSNQPEIIAEAAHYQLWAIAIPMAGYVAFMWDGILVGITRTRLMLWSMLGATATFFILNSALATSLGNHALWLAFIAYLLMRGILQTIFFRDRATA
jgi:MATE family multidrug resistance protein